MRAIRRHLTYANVVATIAAFVVLCGGAALAANQLGRGSVGKKQLKANAVTSAKIKKNAVTAAKIRANAVDGSKVTAGGLGAADLQVAGTPYTRIVEELRSPLNLALATEPSLAPLPFTYTQEAGRTDSYIGAVDVSFDPSCANGFAVAYVLMDAPPIVKFEIVSIIYAIASGYVEQEGNASRRIHLGTYPGGGTKFAPSTARSHSFTLLSVGKCEGGGGITANSVALDVIGTK